MKLRRAQGFTLLEVLVALAIFALAAILLGGAYVNVLNGYQVAKRATVSDPDVQFARSQLLEQPDVDLARQGGDFEGAEGRHVRWTATIDPTNEADLFTVIFECETTGSNTAKEEKVRQEFRVLRPTWSVAVDRNTLRATSRDRILKILEGVNK
ncbi:MAG: prepilin-type N-terminal cleavage/methylation domain-containing protein [Opitutaceae bacterium]|jgi:general secretion pathway protein I